MPSTPVRRVRTGCITCKKRKLKCDENKPSCRRCVRAKIECAGYGRGGAARQSTSGGYDTFDGARDDAERDEHTYNATSAGDETYDSLREIFQPSLLLPSSWHSMELPSAGDTSDIIWQELLTSFGESSSSTARQPNNLEVQTDITRAEDAGDGCDTATRDALRVIERGCSDVEQRALLTALRWSPPAFAFPRPEKLPLSRPDDHLRANVGRSAWSRTFVYFAQTCPAIVSFLIAFGLRFLQPEEDYSVEDARRKDSIGRSEASKGRSKLSALYRAVQQANEHSTQPRDQSFLQTQCHFIACTIMFTIYEEIDRGMTDAVGVSFWEHALDMTRVLPEVWCAHFTCKRSQRHGNTQNDGCLCEEAGKDVVRHLRVLVRILAWKTILYDATNRHYENAERRTALTDILRQVAEWDRWERINIEGHMDTLEGMAVWNVELLDVIQQSKAWSDVGRDSREKSCAYEQFITRIRIARSEFSSGDDDGTRLQRQTLFDVLRLSTQLFVQQSLSIGCNNEGDEELSSLSNPLKVMLGMRFYMITARKRAQAIANYTSENVHDLFGNVQSYLHLHLAFPFMLAAVQISSSEQQKKLLAALGSISNESSRISAADRNKDATTFLRTLLTTIWASTADDSKVLHERIGEAVQQIGFVGTKKVLYS